MQPVDTNRPGFQPLGCGSICTQGFALGWYRSAPLALEAIRRVWIFGSVTTSAFSQTDPLPARALWLGGDHGGEAGFSATLLAKARAAPVEMTILWWGWRVRQLQKQRQKQIPT